MRRHLASCAAALTAAAASLGLCAGVAVAATTTPAATSTTSTTPATPTAPPATPTTPPATPTPPVKAAAKLYLTGTFTVSRDSVSVPHRNVQVQGYVRPYVAGQTVLVQSYVGTHRFKTDHLRIKPASKGVGAFTENVQAPAVGVVRVKVTHAKTAQMLGFFAARAYAALDTAIGFGARGPFVTLVQQQLAALHVYVPQTGVYDTQTGLALDAYHRLLGWGEGNQSVDARTVSALLNGDGSFHIRYAKDGNHAEGDLSRQILVLITGGTHVYRIYPISSGKPSTPTVLGRFQVYYRVPGYLPDGMYFSSFFYRGYAIHGFDPAPDYPASHGCMRVPIIDAVSIFGWITYGDWVDVYYE